MRYWNRFDRGVPADLVRPLSGRPKKREHWSYLEKNQFWSMVNGDREELEYVNETGKLPPHWLPKKAKELRSWKVLSQRTNENGEKYWALHRSIKDEF